MAEKRFAKCKLGPYTLLNIFFRGDDRNNHSIFQSAYNFYRDWWRRVAGVGWKNQSAKKCQREKIFRLWIKISGGLLKKLRRITPPGIGDIESYSVFAMWTVTNERLPCCFFHERAFQPRVVWILRASPTISSCGYLVLRNPHKRESRTRYRDFVNLWIYGGNPASPFSSLLNFKINSMLIVAERLIFPITSQSETWLSSSCN